VKRFVLFPLALVAGLVASVLGLATAAPSVRQGTAPSAEAKIDIPTSMLRLYQSSAATCPGLSWTVLAAIGKVESDHGRSTGLGVHSGQNARGAMGPMQMLGPTFDEYANPTPAGGAVPPSPYDPADAIYAAARLLCANGAGNETTLRPAVYAYNHADWYVDAVLAQATAYGFTATSFAPADAGRALAFAFRQVGTPYEFGGTGADGRFDCSGLTQAAWAAAGVALPRTSEDQWLALPHIARSDLQPGDLIFFNPGEFRAGLPGHVGLYIGNGYMVDAPHTGAVVRIEPIVGFSVYVGASRP
jgi:cell wall-associated NlpC family hydrolase